MSIIKEFKEFASKGNVTDMAVGVVIGGAFQKIISSLVEDVITPAISIFTGKADFTELYWTVNGAVIKYGNFLTAIIDFLIVAFSLFLALKVVNSFNERAELLAKGGLDKVTDAKLLKKLEKLEKFRKKHNEPEPEPTVKDCPYCYSEINIKATRCPHCTAELAKVAKEIVK